MTRFSDDLGARELVDAMADPERLVRHAAMAALMHRSPAAWQGAALSRNDPQILTRALVAGIAGEQPIDETATRKTIASLLALNAPARQDQLDILRILALFQKTIENEDALRARVVDHIVQHFPDSDREVRWEQIRLLGSYRASQGFSGLLKLLESEKDEVTQFHIAQSIVRLPSGWTNDEKERLIYWFAERQRGWFTEFADKGVEFPDFWATVLMDLTRQHRQFFLTRFQNIVLTSPMGRAVIQLLAEDPASEERLLGAYRRSEKPEARLRIIESLRTRQSPGLKAFLLAESKNPDVNLHGALLKSFAAQKLDAQDLPLLTEGLRHSDSGVVQACAEALRTLHPSLDANLAALMIARMEERRDLLRTMNATLAALAGIDSGLRRPDQRIDDALRAAVPRFWKDWYERAFQQKFQSQANEGERSDEQVLKVILASNFESASTRLGARIYERVQCNGCHGGGVSPGQEGRIFGPELSGVTRRLSRAELAEALVYPSKQVADRFKAVEITFKDGESITGFVTERSAEAVTIATREQVSRIPMPKIQSIAPQATSLMPQGLLNRLSDEEVGDLLAFLDRMGTP